MNTCIRSTFKCIFEVFKARVMKDQPSWSQFVDDHQIAKVDEYKSIMLMNVSDFEAMEVFMTTDKMRAWDAEHGCKDTVYALSLIWKKNRYN